MRHRNVRRMLTLLIPILAALSAPTTATEASRVALVPVEQRLELQIDPAAPAWSGSLLAKLDVQGTTRRFELRLGRASVSRVELSDSTGRVRLSWGVRPDGRLLVETARAPRPGTAWLNVAFEGSWSPPPGIGRDSLRAIARLAGGAGLDLPEWPGRPATPWTLFVHAPAACEVRASGRRTGIDENPPWRTWNFRVARPLPADSLRVTVRPRSPRR